MSKSELQPIERIVASQLSRCFPDAATPKLVVGVSGGADSMSLLHILSALEVELFILHINYHKRGAASNRDAALVTRTAERLAINCQELNANPDKAAGKNFQQWARNFRYRAFRTKARGIAADGIVTAHHRDDQIETILQKIFRGSGLASWSAMSTCDGELFRPLLTVTRTQIEDYCRRNSITFRDDASNTESKFARNFLRNKWLPNLSEHFPGWDQNVLRVSEQGAVFSAALDFILDRITDEDGHLKRGTFLNLEPSLQKSLLLYWIRTLDEEVDISRAALGELKKLSELQTGSSLQLKGPWSLLRDRQFLQLIDDRAITQVDEMISKKKLGCQNIVIAGVQLGMQKYRTPDFSRHLYLDAQYLSWPLRIRKWQPGDRFQPFGMRGHQTVASHLTNRKISAARKSQALVIESFEETICAVIFPSSKKTPPGPISEQLKCTASTRQCVTIKQIA